MIPATCRAALLFGLVALAAISVRATTVLPLTFEQLVSGASLVFEGETVDVRPRASNERDGLMIVTDVTFRVVRALKGFPSPMIRLSFVGGTVGDRTLTVEGMPAFTRGDRDVVFAHEGDGHVSAIVGLMYGRFPITYDAPTGETFVRRFDGLPIRALADVASQIRRPLLAMDRPMALSAFEAAIAAEVARQRGGPR